MLKYLKKFVSWAEGDGNQEIYFAFWGAALPFLLGLGGKWLGSSLFGGKEPERPEMPEMGPFQPYKMPIQPRLDMISKILEREGQKATRGMRQKGASTGTYYGGQPGAVEIEAAKTKTMGEATLGLMEEQSTETLKQYANYMARKYGYESAEWKSAMEEYLLRLKGQQTGKEALISGGLGALGSIGGMLPWDKWFGGGDSGGDDWYDNLWNGGFDIGGYTG